MFYHNPMSICYLFSHFHFVFCSLFDIPAARCVKFISVYAVYLWFLEVLYNTSRLSIFKVYQLSLGISSKNFSLPIKEIQVKDWWGVILTIITLYKFFVKLKLNKHIVCVNIFCFVLAVTFLGMSVTILCHQVLSPNGDCISSSLFKLCLPLLWQLKMNCS